jgi:hypothetical protein
MHDGAEARRVDKLMKIAECELALANLRVCINDMNVNCGKCSKCLRTMVPLHFLRRPGAPFPPLPSLKKMSRLQIGDAIEKVFFEENLDLGLHSEDKELCDALSACMRRHNRRHLMKEIMRLFVGALPLKRTYRAIVRSSPGPSRIDTS